MSTIFVPQCVSEKAKQNNRYLKVMEANGIVPRRINLVNGLGEIPSPITETSIIDERQARWRLKSLRILNEKTKGNLTEKEQEALTATLKEIAMIFSSKIERA